MTKETKSVICTMSSIILPVILITALVELSCTKSEDHYTKLHNRYKEDCVKLNAKYGHLYQTKEGPFSGVTFYGVDFGDEAVTLKVYNSVVDSEPRTFRCADLVEVQESK